MSMVISTLIEEAKRVYAAAGLDCGDALLPPADEGALEAINELLGLEVPSELREVYRVHGGQGYVAASVTGLFGMHRLHTPAEIIEHHQMFADHCLLDPLPEFPPPADQWGYWVPQLIPFASWDAYDLCVDAQTGEVWEFIPNSGLIRHRTSIAAVLQEVIEAVQSGREPHLGAMRGPV
ncbi:MAG: SMI1/KNR4 family protein [Isosphaeraceae bacterium]